jgi:hypothetical protein
LFIRVAKGERILSVLAAPEKGFVNIALYTDHDVPQHITRQTSNGKWLSKFGQMGIETHTLEAIEGSNYGYVDTAYRVPEKEWRKIRDMPLVKDKSDW